MLENEGISEVLTAGEEEELYGIAESRMTATSVGKRLTIQKTRTVIIKSKLSGHDSTTPVVYH